MINQDLNGYSKLVLENVSTYNTRSIRHAQRVANIEVSILIGIGAIISFIALVGLYELAIHSTIYLYYLLNR